MRTTLYILVLFLTFGLFACNDNTTTFEDDIATLEDYFTENNLNPIQHPQGIFYTIDQEGTGANPSAFATVIVKYKGMLLNGNVFDQTEGNKTAQFNLRGTIPGFQIAVTLLKRGGKGTFYMPSSLGYGRVAQGEDIPANSILIFEIELIDFQN